MAVFWDVAPCSLIYVFRRFRGAYCPHYHGMWHNIPEDSHLRTCRENLKFYHRKISCVDVNLIEMTQYHVISSVEPSSSVTREIV
jgi:hypothetical protein